MALRSPSLTRVSEARNCTSLVSLTRVQEARDYTPLVSRVGCGQQVVVP